MIIVEAKHISKGPNSNTKVSTKVVQQETVKSTILSTVKEKRRPPNTWKDRTRLTRDDDDDDDDEVDVEYIRGVINGIERVSIEEGKIVVKPRRNTGSNNY